MAWILVIVAGVLETGFALALKASDGFSRLVPSLVFVALGAASLWLLSLALRTLPVGSAYAVWTGIGAAGTGLVGMVALREPATALRIAGILMIIGGVVALRAAGGR